MARNRGKQWLEIEVIMARNRGKQWLEIGVNNS